MARTRSSERAPEDEALERLPPQIRRKLLALVRRVRWIQIRRGCLAVLAVGAITVILLMVIGASFTILSPALKTTLSLLGLGAIAVSAYRTLYRPLRRELTLGQMARILERRHPELHERISTAIDLLGNGDSNTFAGSQELLSKVVESATADAEGLLPEQEFTNRTAKRYALALAAAALLLGAGFLVFPAPASRMLTQAVAPFSKVGNAYAERLQVRPGDLRVAEGEAISIQVTVDGADTQRAEIHSSGTDGVETVESLALIGRDTDADTSEFAITFPAVEEGFSYRIRSGRAVSSSHEIEVAERPEIRRLELSYQFPEYTGQPPLVTTRSDLAISAITGTQIQIRAHFDRPLESAILKIDGNPLPATDDQSSEANNPRATWQFAMLSGTDGKWRIELRDANSIPNRPSAHPIRAIPDLPPALRLLGEQDELRVRPDERLGIRYEVDEDFGLAAAYARIEGLEERTPLPLPERGDEGQFSGVASLDLSQIPQPEGSDTVRVFIGVEDTRPDPQAAEAGPITITIDPEVGSLAEQSVERQRQEIQRSLAGAVEKLQVATALSQEFPGQFVKPDLLPLELLPPLAEARTLIGEAESIVRATAALAAQPSNFFRRLAPGLARAADDHLASARQAAEEIPLTDAKVTRVHRAHKVVRQLREGVAELEVCLRELKQQAGTARAMAQIGDMSERQQRLAEALGESADPVEQQELLNQQSAIAEAIAKLAADGHRPIADQLLDARHHASALAELAGDLSLQQASLSSLLDRSADPSLHEATTQALVKKLESEQRQIGNATSAGGETSAAAGSDPAAVRRLGEIGLRADGAARAIAEGQLDTAASLGTGIGESLEELSASVSSQPVREPIDRLAAWQHSIAEQLRALASGSLEQALSLRQKFVADRAEDLARRTDRFQQLAESLADPSALKQLQGASARATEAARSARQASSQLDGGTSGGAFEFARSPDTIPPHQNRAPNGASLPTQAGVDAAGSTDGSPGEGDDSMLENPFSVGAPDLDEPPPAVGVGGETSGGSGRPPEQGGQAKLGSGLVGSANPATGQTSVASAAQQPAMQAQRDLADANSALSNAAGSFTQQANGLPGQIAAQVDQQMLEVARQAAQLALERNPETIAELAAGLAESLARQEPAGSQIAPPDDWQKIRGTVRSGVASANRGTAPDAYRDLVKRYFREIARRSNDSPDTKR